jgi:AbrB family looped-hinge helix DNA binding protein
MRVTSKGQVTIPQRVREALGIKPGEEVEFDLRGREAVLRPARSRRQRVAEWIEQARGSADTDLTTDEIMRMTRGDE